MKNRTPILNTLQENLSDSLERIGSELTRQLVKIRYVDGHRFRLAVIVAAKRLIANQDYLNKINVFPVPDGDTGTNMASTLHTIIIALRNTSHAAIDSMSSEISESAFEGARGNSGVILAQFFYGLALQLENKRHVSTLDFSYAAEQAASQSYTAMENPQEGTILSVIRIWAEAWRELAPECDDFSEILDLALDRSRKELEQSPKKLKVLRNSNVVDAGAQGFVHMLEGIRDFIRGGKIREIWEELKEIAAPFQTDSESIAFDPEVKYRYCTECLMDADSIDRDAIRKRLGPLGNSMILAGTQTRLKLHIHTDTPEEVFSILEEYGSVRRKKADDMKKQVELRSQKEKSIALVVDSTADLPEDLLSEYNINVVPVRVSFGGKEFIDKVTIDNATFYRKLVEGPHHPKTSQPSPRDFVNMYRYLSSHYEQILSIHVTSALSGTYQTAKAAGEEVSGANIHFFDSKLTSLGLGLTAMKAGELIRQKKSMDEILDALRIYIERSRLYIVFGGLDFVIKGGRLNKNIGKFLKFLGLLPLIYFDPQGKLGKDGFIKNAPDNFKKVIIKMKNQLKNTRPEHLAVIHANAPEKAQAISAELEKEFPGVPVILSELGPALGVHAGPGTVGLGYFLS